MVVSGDGDVFDDGEFKGKWIRAVGILSDTPSWRNLLAGRKPEAVKVQETIQTRCGDEDSEELIKMNHHFAQWTKSTRVKRYRCKGEGSGPSNSATGFSPITDDSSYYKTYQRRGPRIKKAQPGRSKESSLLKQKTIWRIIGLKPAPIAGQGANLAINPVLSANQRIHNNFQAEQKTATPEFLSSDADDEGDITINSQNQGNLKAWKQHMKLFH
ncbi:hypothetical protein HAX54_030845 [Datura stramonium]|uniref:Uncharacterized protein n=1 Tax=Datura stramonium TaxID=4076 RepID=A0ABS8VAM5_DATST|nr:hypothetical protein [Datura stramonium]